MEQVHLCAFWNRSASPDLSMLISSQSNRVPLKAKSGRLFSGDSERDLEAGGVGSFASFVKSKN
jgi:hypothetical protein